MLESLLVLSTLSSGVRAVIDQILRGQPRFNEHVEVTATIDTSTPRQATPTAARGIAEKRTRDSAGRAESNVNSMEAFERVSKRTTGASIA